MLYDFPDLYDALLPASVAQVNFYCNLARVRAGSVLELACGSGQLIVPIAAQGWAATGLDLSAKMLAAAQRRAAAAAVQVKYIEAEMRDFNIGRHFSFIFIARNSLLHLIELDDFAAFFSAVRHHLEPGGVLAFDVFNPSPQVVARPSEDRFRSAPRVRSTSGAARCGADRGLGRAEWER